MKINLKFILLLALLLVVFVADLLFGSVSISLYDMMNPSEVVKEIIYNFRLPKALTALVVGGAIGLAGLLMQVLFRNPLAGPYILGVSSGASLGVAIYLLAGSFLPIILMQSTFGLAISAIIGAFAVMFIVLGLSFRIRNSVSLLIVGMMIGQIAGALVSILQNASNPDKLKLFIVWTFGSLSAVTWNVMWVMIAIVLIGVVIAFFIQKQLNAMVLGENYAQSLGVNISKLRFLIIVATALLAGGTTAFTGPIAFIGIAVPHIAKGIFKTYNHRVMIPASIIVGAVLLMLCDIATVLSPSGYTLPINAVSSLVGTPFILWIILRKN